MLTPAGPPASLPPPKRRFGRRLNRVPAVIAVGAGCIIAGAVAYTLHERAEEEARQRQLVQAAPSGADASGVLKNAPNGWIPPTKKEQASFNFTPAPAVSQNHPAADTKAVPEDADNGRETERKAAWARYWSEYEQLHKERFDKRHEALLALKTSVDAPAPAHSETSTVASAATPPTPAAQVPSAGGTPGLWGGGGFGGFGGYGLATPQIDKEGQEQKIGFAGQQGDLGKNDVVPTVRRPPDPYAVMAGSFVKFTTINEVNSDVPGSTIGMVTESVYNTSNGTCVLIPSGSKLIGHYNTVVSTGQSRLPGVLTRIIFPDGSSQAIGAMETADNAGSAGMDDQINRHLIQKFGSAFVASLMGAAIQLSVPQNGSNSGYNSTQIIGASVGQQMGQLGQQIALQNLSIPNTLTIRAGYNGTMITDKDLHIQPWSCDGTRRASLLPIMQISGQ